MQPLTPGFIPGTLKIKTIPGRHGDFQIGELELPFATLEIKEAWLANFDDGEFCGEFLLQRLYLKSFPTKFRGIMTVLCGDVPEFTIVEADEGKDTGLTNVVEMPEPAPEAPPVASTLAVTATAAPPSCPTPGAPGDTPPETTAVQTLFGVYFGDDCVTLNDLPDCLNFKQLDEDVVQDRARLRAMSDLLNHKKGGTHKFDPITQNWDRVRHLSDEEVTTALQACA